MVNMCLLSPYQVCLCTLLVLGVKSVSRAAKLKCYSSVAQTSIFISSGNKWMYISDSLAAEKLYDDWVNINALHKSWLYDQFGYWLMIKKDELS